MSRQDVLLYDVTDTWHWPVGAVSGRSQGLQAELDRLLAAFHLFSAHTGSKAASEVPQYFSMSMPSYQTSEDDYLGFGKRQAGFRIFRAGRS